MIHTQKLLNYILLVKDINISSKKIIFERFLCTKFRDQQSDELWAFKGDNR